MSGTHGDLFSEIGKLVLAAHAGQAIDLTAKSEEMARRYWKIGVPAETIAKAIARSLGAISMSMAIVSAAGHSPADANGHSNGFGGNGEDSHGEGVNGHSPGGEEERAEAPAKAASALFPSGVRLAVLS